MAEERVSKKIREDAQKRAEEIREEAKRRAKEIEERAKVEARRIEEEAKAEALEASGKESERLIALERLEIRKSLLAAKRSLVDEAFERAVSWLNSLKKEEYRRFVKKLLLKAIETGDEEVIVSPEENRTDRKFLHAVSQELDDGGKLKLSQEKREMRGGFILKRGRVEVKATFDSLVNELRDELEMEVAKLLFSR